MHRIEVIEWVDVKGFVARVNEFIKDKQIVDIKFSTTYDNDLSRQAWYTAMIIYKII